MGVEKEKSDIDGDRLVLGMTDFVPATTVGEPSIGYDPAAVALTWQARWEASGTNAPTLDGAPRPYSPLMLFPYPTREAFHVRALCAFPGSAVHRRQKR